MRFALESPGRSPRVGFQQLQQTPIYKVGYVAQRITRICSTTHHSDLLAPLGTFGYVAQRITSAHHRPHHQHSASPNMHHNIYVDGLCLSYSECIEDDCWNRSFLSLPQPFVMASQPLASPAPTSIDSSVKPPLLYTASCLPAPGLPSAETSIDSFAEPPC